MNLINKLINKILCHGYENLLPGRVQYPSLVYVHQGRLITVQMFLLNKESVKQKSLWHGYETL
jgi:hypothetical protein